MTARTVKYSGYQLFHAISYDNDTTTVHVIYFPRHKVEATQVLYRLPCILYQELLVITNVFITISGIERATMGIWDKEKRTFANSNELHNEESMEGVFKGTGLTALYLDQEPKYVLKNRMEYFDEANLQKVYTWAQGKYYEPITIASR